ncbi:WcaF family extracellular polysaccharide biosynthesis acetyltransferase [uncultured Bacteroides sp.]|uniref:WcaF family extracellular polysaccharide biosynthesis acetyltransferase n=1 Tax=uncultured Bacteroides sp. TaxID=162156 RepID=UPI0026250151|nr:WcaF family extracellular polysaccharide biosynthesis acetyltransferase [uncultured Bacteroides sp.]
MRRNDSSQKPIANLAIFTTGNFSKRATPLKITLWYFVNALIVRASWNPFMGIKIALLKAFGAKIGKGLIIKNNVCVKFPWKLTVGDNVWLGENCWIDNLDYVTIGNNVCISQGALLLTGNHDYTLTSFDYRNAPIIIEDGAWVGAKSVVCPGVTVHSHAILTVGSIATKDMEEYSIYQGNPAKQIRKRIIR